MESACLLYHNLGLTGDHLTLDPGSFRAQMRRVRDRGYATILSSQVANSEISQPSRSVLIAFDDGFESFVDHAVPTLVELGLRATVFLSSSFLGNTSPWFGLRCMSPRQVREALASGAVEIGSHTRHHVDLRALTPSALLEELRTGRDDLEQLFGVPVSSLSYPFGAHNPAVVDAARHVFERAFTTRQGLNTPQTNRYMLRRTTVDRYEDMLGLWIMLRFGYH